MLIGIIVVSIPGLAGFCGAVVSVAGIILNFQKDKAKVRRGVITLIACVAALMVTGGVNAVLIAKKDGKKVYEVELELNNNIPRNEGLYFGSIIANKYLLACDKDDYVCDIVPLDNDAGFTTDGDLISPFEFILNREYTKYGKILPGKTKHKILVLVPEDVGITSLRLLNTRIDLR
ncbi:MAG: hypothetical protein LBS06_01335 [Treponema sp.]|jgi:hypothetical protein|nr:hypothetical protein [Treponema sp.]